MECRITLSTREIMRISQYRERLRSLQVQIDAIQMEADTKIAALLRQGNEVADMLQVAFEAAVRRVQLEHPEIANINIPDFMDNRGEQAVATNMSTGEVKWVDPGVTVEGGGDIVDLTETGGVKDG